MIDAAFLDDVLGRMLAAGLTELELEDGDRRVVLRLGVAAAAPKQQTLAMEVRATAIGRFRIRHPRRPDTAIGIGDRVRRGAVLGYLELGATLTAVTAPADGTVTGIVPAEGQLMGYGDHLFTIEGKA